MSIYDADQRALADYDRWLTSGGPGADDYDLDALEVLHASADAATEDLAALDEAICAAIGPLDVTAAFDLLDADADALAATVMASLERRQGPGPARCAPRSEADIYDGTAPWHALDEDLADAAAERRAVGR